MYQESQKQINFDDLFELEDLGILVVDMQLRFVNRIFSDDEYKKVLNSQFKVLKKAAEKNTPTCLVEYADVKAGKTIDDIYNLMKKIENNLYISKSKNSVFYEPLIHNFLRINKVKNLVVMGFHANLCLKETIKDALDRGFIVHTSDNLITDYVEDKKKEALNYYNNNCIMINFDDISK